DRLDAEVAAADLVIGAVLEPGTLSPKLISRAAVRAMRPGSALVDVGIDQGGIAATSRMTTLSSPTYVDEGVVHYAVPNMPTLIETLIPRLTALGLAVSLVKHAHHAFDVDQPGKDSYRHRLAGCTEVLVSSPVRWALMHELRGAAELSLADALARLSPCDIVL